ncbi:MAG: DUF1700 domain-containing protein [Oscillospiraceae bacterium]|nr:DUF1700 domain-containing protein [Oscillospiraceae bacterium]
MTSAEFLKQLESNLSSLPEEERENAMSYYREYFEEAGPEDEDAAAERLGSPQSVAERIIHEVGDAPQTDDETVHPEEKTEPEAKKTEQTAAQYDVPPLAEKASSTAAASGSSGHLLLGIVLICVTFPIWITILSVVFSIIVSLAAVILSFAAAGLAAPVTGIFMILDGSLGLGLYQIGGGLMCLGLALLLWKPCYLLIRLIVQSCIKGAGLFFRWMSGKEKN